MIVWKTSGVCSRSISFDISADGVVHDVSFDGGCHGNAQGIARLVEGRTVEDIVSRLTGITCGSKQTSCPDQLARALLQQRAENAPAERQAVPGA